MLKLAGELSDGQLADHIAHLDAHTFNWMQTIQTGQYFYPIPVATTAQRSMVAGTIYAIPFVVSRAITIDRLAIWVKAAGAGGTVARLGIYADDGDCYPGALVVDAGTVAVDAIAIVAATINQSLTKGLYWLVIVSDGTPQIYLGYFAWSPLGNTATDFSTAWVRSQWSKASVGTGALADPFVSGATAGSLYGYLILPRLASLD
jgi:hypothetical protein